MKVCTTTCCAAIRPKCFPEMFRKLRVTTCFLPRRDQSPMCKKWRPIGEEGRPELLMPSRASISPILSLCPFPLYVNVSHSVKLTGDAHVDGDSG